MNDVIETLKKAGLENVYTFGADLEAYKYALQNATKDSVNNFDELQELIKTTNDKKNNQLSLNEVADKINFKAFNKLDNITVDSNLLDEATKLMAADAYEVKILATSSVLEDIVLKSGEIKTLDDDAFGTVVFQVSKDGQSTTRGFNVSVKDGNMTFEKGTNNSKK